VDGVVSLTPVEEQSCIAVELQIAANQGVAGLRWYNNDANARFPKVLVVGGEDGHPSLQATLAEATTVAGTSSGWSEVRFETAVAGEGGPLYAVFQLPPFQERSAEGTGGGAGVGFRHAEGGAAAYLSPDGQEWVGLARGIQLAVAPLAVPVTSGMVTQSAKRAGGAVATPEPQPDAVRYATALESVAPNPSNPSVTVRFTLAAAGSARLTVYDVRGRRVRTLLSETLGAGPHVVDWNGRDESGQEVSSGVYHVRLQAAGELLERAVTLVR
jgi:hypothetical protein